MKKQKIHCEYKSNGCKELLTIETLPRHVSSCLYVNTPSVSMELTDMSDDGSNIYAAATKWIRITHVFNSSTWIWIEFSLNLWLKYGFILQQDTPASESQQNSYEDAVMEATTPGKKN